MGEAQVTDFSKNLFELANHIAEKALDSDTPFAEALDAMGKLTSYYGLLLKSKGKADLPETDEPTIGRIMESIQAADEGLNGRKRRPPQGMATRTSS